DITEFWRRWHISLSTWLRDYLYISFGGSRHGKWRTYRNLMLTMLLGGFWHGASWNFIIWGGINGFYLCIEKITGLPNYKSSNLISKGLRISYVFILISFSWIFFRAVKFGDAISIIKKIFLDFNLRGFNFLDSTIFSSIIIGIFLLVSFEYLIFRNYSFEQLFDKKNGQKWLFGFTIFFIFVIIFLGNSNGSQFIYFQF
ncbi:MAG: MBOAT family O-acyltransferase, partial [Ferruginibacter sp.]